MDKEERVGATEDREAARGRPLGPKEAARPQGGRPAQDKVG